MDSLFVSEVTENRDETEVRGGDLLVEVLVSRSNAFERQDMNIFSNASISFGIAALT